jgi:hypothetical protein
MLGYFAIASEELGGQEYPSLVLALPTLRLLKLSLEDTQIFKTVASSNNGVEFVPRIVQLMQSVRMTYVELFTARFSGMLKEIMCNRVTRGVPGVRRQVTQSTVDPYSGVVSV